MRLLLATIAMLVVLSACSGPGILSCWDSLEGANRIGRVAPHAGVDFGELRGAPVLAAMDGRVAWTGQTQGGCGKGIALRHDVASPNGNRFTLYCHLLATDVLSGQRVSRGEVIGWVGTSGSAFGVPHLHFEVSADSTSHADGDLSGTEDPMRYYAGCFDPQRTYPMGEFVLTYPVRCTIEPRLEC